MKQNPTKFQAMKSDKDRISELPDDIIWEIISNLPTKDAVVTTILSKRWKDQWTYCFNLDFRGKPNFNEDNEEDLKIYVKDVVALNKSPYIKNFRLQTNLMNNADVTACLDLISRRNVEAIQLDDPNFNYSDYTFTLPRSLFTCHTLVFLDISSYAVYDLPPSIHLPNLKVFRAMLYDPPEEKEITEVLFSNLPVLEDLSIRFRTYVIYEITLDIFTPNLKRLKLELESNNIINGVDYQIFVRVPSLEELDIFESSYIFTKFVFEELPLDFKARLGIDDCCAKSNYKEVITCTIQLVNEISQGKSLELSSCILGTYFRKTTFCCDPPTAVFSNVTCLEVDVTSCCGFTYLPNLIDRLPNLVSLVLKMVPSDGDEDEDEYGDEDEEQGPLWHEPQCLLLHNLKKIEVRGFEGQEHELKFLGYLLKVAEVLDEVVIYTCRIALEERKYLCRNLSSFPCCSKNCQFKILEKISEDVK